MSFDPVAYHTTQSANSKYAASQNLTPSTTWQHTATGLELIDNDNEEPFVATIVGRVSALRLKCGPGGNHFPNGAAPLAKAKYQFHICKPANKELGEDYLAGIHNLEILQHQVAQSNDRRNMIIQDVTGKMLRFTKNVFVPRDTPIPDSPHGQANKDAPVMDDETKNWPIPDEFGTEFDTLKYSMRANPLPLYHDNHLVDPVHANEIMNGAMVEVQFSVQHWHIREYDTFQATAEKISILKLGPIHVPSHYKRANPEEHDTGQPETKKARVDKKKKE